MYKRDLDKIAKKKGIRRRRTKAETIKVLVKKLKLDEIRKYHSELFKVKGLDLKEHKLVPPHRILSKEEKKKLRKKYHLKSLRQLPRIKASDPAVMVTGGVIGDVIEITRKSPVAGETKYYRLVVR